VLPRHRPVPRLCRPIFAAEPPSSGIRTLQRRRRCAPEAWDDTAVIPPFGTKGGVRRARDAGACNGGQGFLRRGRLPLLGLAAVECQTRRAEGEEGNG